MVRHAQHRPVQRDLPGDHLSEVDPRWRALRRRQVDLLSSAYGTHIRGQSSTHACCRGARNGHRCRPPQVADPFGLTLSEHKRRRVTKQATAKSVHSNMRTMTIPHQRQAQEELVLFYSVTNAAMIDSPCYHIANTSEGCQISRDEEIGFVVKCGKNRAVQRHVPTLSAAYAICQQLMPRYLTSG